MQLSGSCDDTDDKVKRERITKDRNIVVKLEINREVLCCDPTEEFKIESLSLTYKVMNDLIIFLTFNHFKLNE